MQNVEELRVMVQELNEKLIARDARIERLSKRGTSQQSETQGVDDFMIIIGCDSYIGVNPSTR